MSEIHFTADTHYGHKNIVRGTSEWTDKSGCRDFDTVEEHNDVLVDNINSMVKPNDILYHLGDWSFGGFENILEFRNRIQCRDVRLILGNHDHHITKNKHQVRGIFSFVDNYLAKKIGGVNMVLSHYAMRVWDAGHHGVWQLYGHSHGSLPEYQNEEGELLRTMDVGVDTNDLFPYHIDHLKLLMKDRVAHALDHHDKSTT